MCVFFLSKYSNDFALKVSVLVLVRDLTLYSPCMCMCSFGNFRVWANRAGRYSLLAIKLHDFCSIQRKVILHGCLK